MHIQVIGSGCATCKQLHALTLRAVERIEAETTVEYVAGQEGMERLMELGLVRSPAITVNGTVALVGFEPSIDAIKDHILAAAGQ